MEPESGAFVETGLGFTGLTEFLGRPDPAATADFAPGKRLGDVTIVRLLGEGGMGRVYEGLQEMPRRAVAVKAMRPGVLSVAAAKRFEHEAHILGRLNHPGIARIYSAGTETVPGGVVPYFVMEYIDEARSITAYAAAHELSARDRVTLFREVCRAVAHGHQRGVIHRDLKPGNILVDARGLPKIIDFGVARNTDSDVALTTLHTDVGQLVGTLQYMSPEQFAGASDDLDVRADVYALGVVLYELLVGKPPYDVSRLPIYDVARVIREVEPASVSTVNPKLRGDLNTIVAKCLEKERGRRYSSAAELEADLGRYLCGEPIAASPPGLVDSVVRLARRHKLAALAATGMAVTLVAGMVGVSVFALQAERERKAAIIERERANAASREANDQLYVANLRALRAGLADGNLRLAREVYKRNLALVPGPPPLEMRLLGAGLDDALVVLDVEGRSVQDVAYSPDGEILAVAVNDEKLYQPMEWIMPAVTQPRLSDLLFFFSASGRDGYIRREACDDAWVACWRSTKGRGQSPVVDESGVRLAVSQDGRLLARHERDGSICIVDRSGVNADVMVTDFRGRVAQVAFNVDGGRFAALDPGGELRLWDAVGGGLLAHLGRDLGQVERFVFSPNGSKLAVVATAGTPVRVIHLFDAGDGHRLSAVTPAASSTKELAMPLMAFSPDGGRLVTTVPDRGLGVWSVATGELLGTLRGHATAITAVAFSPDGTQIASGNTNGQIRLWNADGLAEQRSLTGHDQAVTALAFRGDGETLASASAFEDSVVRVWSRSLDAPLAVLPERRGMTAVAFSPDGQLLAVAPRNTGGVELWNPRTVERVHRLTAPDDAVAQVAFCPDGTLVAAVFGDPNGPGEARVWDTASGEIIATLGGHVDRQAAVSFSPDGSRLVVTWGDADVMVWERQTGRWRQFTVSLRGVPSRFGPGAVFGLNGSRIHYLSHELIDATTGEVAGNVRMYGNMTCQAVGPDGRMLAIGVASGSVYLADFETGERRETLKRHLGQVRAIAFSSDGSHVVAGAQDGAVRLWNVRSGREQRTFVGHEGSVETVTFTLDGRRVVTGSADGTARIWDVASGHEMCAVPSQPMRPAAVAVDPAGACLVTAAADGPIRIWGLSNADVIRARQAVNDPP